jgi:hypothetical protein
MVIYFNPIKLNYDEIVMVALFVPNMIMSRLSVVFNFAISFDRFQVRNSFIEQSYSFLGDEISSLLYNKG